MLKILLIYTSMTGNTEKLANVIDSEIKKSREIELTKVDVFDFVPDNVESFDCIIIGTYTYDDGDIPDEMLDFFDELESKDLNNQLFALFGSGDTVYDDFCGALDQFEDMLKTRGAIIPTESLKVDLEPTEDDLNRCKELINILLSQYLPPRLETIENG